MSNSQDDFIAQHLRNSCEVLQRAADDPKLRTTMAAIADAITRALRSGGKLMIAGNGGSAGDAQHIAGEFLARMNFDRQPLAAVALSADSSVLTAIGNDYGFDKVFERQVRGLARPQDVLMAISTSGRSPNILAAVQAARSMGLTTIGFTGTGGALQSLCDLCLNAPSSETPLIQQIHMAAAHAICSLVEQNLCKLPPPQNPGA